MTKDTKDSGDFNETQPGGGYSDCTGVPVSIFVVCQHACTPAGAGCSHVVTYRHQSVRVKIYHKILPSEHSKFGASWPSPQTCGSNRPMTMPLSTY